MNRRGAIFILSILVVSVLVILGIALTYNTLSENRTSQRQENIVKAFWLAEAGINRALGGLRAGESEGSSSGSGKWHASLTGGEYDVMVELPEGGDSWDRKITAYGYVPDRASSEVTREVETLMVEESTIPGDPDNFYDYAMYSAGDITLNGAAYSVEGDIIYDTDSTITDPATYVNGNISQEEISPLARFNFEALRARSDLQGLVYDVAPNGKLIDPVTGVDKDLPDTFWSPWGSDTVDNDGDGDTDEADEQVNVVYIEGDLALNGNIGTIGGFIVVAGDVITDPDDTASNLNFIDTPYQR